MTEQDIYDVERELYDKMLQNKEIEAIKIEAQYIGYEDGLCAMRNAILKRLNCEENEEKSNGINS